MKKGSRPGEFGELFARDNPLKTWTVSELTQRIRRLLEDDLGQISVRGEISNLRVQSSGHIYFTLKDRGAQLNSVLFRGERVKERDALEDGLSVIVGGDLTVYEPRGQYQLVVRWVELQGAGALQIAFERLKRRLHAEGLFDPKRKRPLPRYPQRIGLITSSSGAAIRDVLHGVQRRHPGLGLIIAPCRVQGNQASREIADSIRGLNEWSDMKHNECGRPGLDLILITRGGGSIEDLWPFNEENVARAIASSGLPTISAIGHEIDFTISDFVADFRAATPSAAAEIVTEGVHASRQFIHGAAGEMRETVGSRLARANDRLTRIGKRMERLHPRHAVETQDQRIDSLDAGLGRSARRALRRLLDRAGQIAAQLERLRPRRRLSLLDKRVAHAGDRMRELWRQRWRQERDQCERLASQLRLLSPLQTLERGYSITLCARSGEILRSADGLGEGDLLKTRLCSGEVMSRIEMRSR